MKKKIESNIDIIFDELEHKLENNELVDNNAISNLLFEVIEWREKRFRKERNCIFNNCNNKSIVRSHSIQKSKSLKLISENNHVLHPMVNEESTRPEMLMKSVGINNASTFPGFCQEHEEIFSGFENDGRILTINQGQLQSYRNICREVVFNNNELESKRYALNRYLELRNMKATEYIRYKSSKELKSVNIDYEDFFVAVVNKYIKKLEEKIVILKKYQGYLFDAISGTKKFNALYTEGLWVNFQFPISLCGIASVGVLDNEIERVAYCILNVVPVENSTTIIIAGLKQDVGILEPYWEYYTQNNISILNMIESFMIHGSDHWFIKPSIWNSISIDKQKIILNDILATEKSFIDQFSLSIFDEVRNVFIEQLETQQKLAYQKNIEDLIVHEKRKFLIENYDTKRNPERAIIDFFNR